MDMPYTIKQQSETIWLYTFDNTNNKGEKLILELVKCRDNNTSNSSPKLWYKKQYIDRVLTTYWSIDTFVKDSEGNCFGMYNPQHKLDKSGKKMTLNFDWMFEATEQNKQKLIGEVYRQFCSASGESATQKKERKIKEFATKRKIDIHKTLPKGWSELIGCQTSPRGSVLISNLKSIKSKEREIALLIL